MYISIPLVEHLRLNLFKKTYKALKTKIIWIDWLLLGLLVWIEDAYIDYKVDKEIDGAIDEYLDTLKKDKKSTVIFKEEWNDTNIPLPTLSFTDHVLDRDESEES